MNSHHPTVDHLAHKFNLSKNRIFRTPEHRLILQIEAGKLYIEGFTYSEIGNIMGIANKTISQWFTKDDILTILYDKPITLSEKGRTQFSRHADYILANQNMLRSKLISILKTQFREINFDYTKLSRISGLSMNLLKDWLSDSRIINSEDVKLSDLKMLEKFQIKYVKFDGSNLEQLIKSKGITPNQIYREIGIYVGHQIRKNQSMLYTNFQKLSNHYDLKLNQNLSYKFVNKKKKQKQNHSLVLQKNQTTAEFVGIMIGDGHLSTEVKISLDSRQKPIIDNIAKIWKEIFKEKNEGIKEKNKNKFDFRSKKQRVVNGISSLGIQKGNKTVNQTSVPTWVQNNVKFTNKCVKGLLDSDGSLYFSAKSLKVSLSNKSKPILNFFEDFCKSNEINYHREFGDRPQVKIQGKGDVKKILRMIQPVKLEVIYNSNPTLLETYFPNYPDLF